jgi:hypothetical protein
MSDNFTTFLLTAVITPLMGALAWFVHRLVEENARSHDRLEEDVKKIKSDVRVMELQMKKLDSSATVLDIDEVRRDIAQVRAAAKNTEAAVCAVKDDVRYAREELRAKINALAEASVSRIQVIEGKQADLEYFKAAVVTRVEATEQTITKLTTLTKDNTIKINQAINNKKTG